MQSFLTHFARQEYLFWFNYLNKAGCKITSLAGISTRPSFAAISSPYIALKTAIGDLSPSLGLGYEFI
jgi:hypothetical protein